MNSFQFVQVSFTASFETLWIVPCLFLSIALEKNENDSSVDKKLHIRHW